MLNRSLALAVMATLIAPSPARAEEEPAAVESAPTATGADREPATDADTKVKKKKKKKKRMGSSSRGEAHDGLTVPWKATATAGMLSGTGTLRESAATTGVSAEVEPSWQRDKLELGVPAKLEHRQTFGASLMATDARLGVDATYRKSPRLRLGGGIGTRVMYKPNWPDEYQPLANGELGQTDRYSHFDFSVGASLVAIPISHWHARVAWELGLINYADDPNFNMLDEPTHLVPGDHTENQLKSEWRYFGEGWKAGVGLDVTYSSYDKQYARDARTGLTHAGAGGPPPNPFYEEANIEPKVTGDVELAGGDAELDLSYGYEINSDRYQGYYSYRGHHPEAKLKWQHGDLEAAAKADLKWRTYGPDSYAQGGAHPPLEYGDRRVDHRFGLGFDVRYSLTTNWSIIGEADALIRRTNFPNYVPNVFPSSRMYDIEWSYENYVVQAGVEFRP